MNRQLKIEILRTRRQFLKDAARNAVVPIVVAYTISKSLFKN
jgi:hypothetical protein